MTAPTLTPAEQISRFIEAHPGEWHHADLFGDGRFGEQSLRVLPGIYLCLVIRGGRVDSIVVAHGHEVDFYGAFLPGDDLLRRGAARVADAMQRYGGTADTLPPWLADPVRRQLRARAGELLTLAGSSPSDVVSAAETVDEALCGRPSVEPTLSAVFAALQGIGMSCRWIRNPGDTGINPEREALEDARAAIACADDEMTREQYVKLFRDLRRVLGVT